MTVSEGVSIKEASLAVAKRAKERMADPRAVWGLPYPFPGLNIALGGIHKSEMTILTARPSMGKTQTMVQTAESVTEYLLTEEGQREYPRGRVKLVLCEGTQSEFTLRWACLRSGVSKRLIETGRLRDYPEKRAAFMRELEGISNLPVDILEDVHGLDQIERFLTNTEKGLTAWWALDYAQKCPVSPNKPNDGSAGCVQLVSGRLSLLAKNVAPGLVLSHTPRDVDKREDRRPRLGDLKGGSSLEGDARVVLGLYAERVYQKLSEADLGKPSPAELLILKNNNGGGTGRTIDLIFQPKKGAFTDVSDLIAELEDDDE